MDYEEKLDAVRHEMTAEEQIERRCDFLIRELDEICRLATNAETVDLVEREHIAIGQIVVRAQLAAALLMAKHPGRLRFVHA